MVEEEGGGGAAAAAEVAAAAAGGGEEGEEEEDLRISQTGCWGGSLERIGLTPPPPIPRGEAEGGRGVVRGVDVLWGPPQPRLIPPGAVAVPAGVEEREEGEGDGMD